MKAYLNERICRLIVLLVVLPALLIIWIFTPKETEPTEADFDL
jgi:hypothetical protein